MMGDGVSSKNLMEFLYPLMVSIVRARSTETGFGSEDVVQDVFIRIFQKLSLFRQGSITLGESESPVNVH